VKVELRDAAVAEVAAIKRAAADVCATLQQRVLGWNGITIAAVPRGFAGGRWAFFGPLSTVLHPPYRAGQICADPLDFAQNSPHEPAASAVAALKTTASEVAVVKIGLYQAAATEIHVLRRDSESCLEIQNKKQHKIKR
jgi:hypothetical protein